MMSLNFLSVGGWASELGWKLLYAVRIVVDREVEIPSQDLSWWQWFWTLFGYSYTTTVRTWQPLVCCLYLLLFIILAMPVVVGLAQLVWYVVTTAFRLLVWLIKSFVFGYLSTYTCVFRWLASDKEPGAVSNVVSESAQFVVGVLPESMREGSPLADYEIPPCQGALGKQTGGTFQAAGCFVRVNDTSSQPWIIMPGHVWASQDRHCHALGRSGTVPFDKVELPATDGRARRVLNVDTDIVAVEITAGEASKLGLQCASIHNGRDTTSCFVKIVGPTGRGSMAKISDAPSLFGYYVYEGSTIGGFSGAAYIAGTNVLAIHLAGGKSNFGYSLRLAYVTLLRLLKMKSEDSEDFLIDQFKGKKRAIRIDNSWGHSDTVRLQIRGEYHIMDADSVRAAVGKGVELEGWVAWEPESTNQGNEQTTTSTGGCASLTESTQAATSERQSLMKELLPELKTVIGNTVSKQLRKARSHGRDSTPTRNRASSTTSEPSPRSQ